MRWLACAAALLFGRAGRGAVDADAATAPRRGSCGVLWFYHLPKCAGTSFLEYLRHKQRSGEVREVVDLTALAGGKLDFAARSAAIDRFAKDPQGWLAVHHHHRGPSLPELRPHLARYKEQLRAGGCELVLTALLRDPVERTLSAMTYNLKSDWQLRQASTAGYWERVMANYKGYDNGEVRYLLNNLPELPEAVPLAFPLGAKDGERAVAQALAQLGDFDVLGTAERYDAFVAAAARRAGWKAEAPRAAKNRTPGAKRGLAPAARALVVEHTRFDRELMAKLRPRLA